MPVRLLALQHAAPVDIATIIGLIDEAAQWLQHKNADHRHQWARPWPNRADRNGRILVSLTSRTTWICWDGTIAAATLTADPDPDPYWSQDRPERPAVYVHRLVVARAYAGLGLGAELLNWAGRTGRLSHGADVLRISAWTTNLGLHDYYRRQGFSPRGFHPDDGYPSRARFEKLTSVIPYCWPPMFSAPSRLLEP
jgi:GNAT superfamily N-acetyltransferase